MAYLGLADKRLLSAKLALDNVGRETRLVPVIGSNVETNKEDRRNPNEQKTGNKAEVGGFHNRKLLSREGITDRRYKLINVRARHRGYQQK